MTFAKKMDNGTNQSSPANDSTGCVLLSLFPFVLVGSIFVAGTFEESGSSLAGWLWIPFSILVMFVFAFVRYRVVARRQHHRVSFSSFLRSSFGFFGRLILVVIVLALIAMIFVHFTGLAGFGGDGR